MVFFCWFDLFGFFGGAKGLGGQGEIKFYIVATIVKINQAESTTC